MWRWDFLRAHANDVVLQLEAKGLIHSSSLELPQFPKLITRIEYSENGNKVYKQYLPGELTKEEEEQAKRELQENEYYDDKE